MPKSLKTKTSVWSAVFRRIVHQLETNADLRRVVGADRIRSWKGVPGDKSPMQPSSSAPVVRLTPNPREVDWYSPDMQAGTLYVRVEMAVESTCIDDVADLWDLFVAALSPSDVAFQQALVSLGAETGEIVFSDPSYDPRPSAKPEGQFWAVGGFHLRTLRSVNP